jgi:hypothetical protein
MPLGCTYTVDQLVEAIETLVAERGAPAYLCCDNGTELIVRALRDWAGRTAPGSSTSSRLPVREPFVETFNSRARDELLNSEEFGSLTGLCHHRGRRIEYNAYRLH